MKRTQAGSSHFVGSLLPRAALRAAPPARASLFRRSLPHSARRSSAVSAISAVTVVASERRAESDGAARIGVKLAIGAKLSPPLDAGKPAIPSKTHGIPAKLQWHFDCASVPERRRI